jgi:hypothetical protein
MEVSNMLVFMNKNNGFLMQMHMDGTSVEVVCDCAKHADRRRAT